MALIKCPECEREISDKAEACPHCGCPTAKNIKQEQLSIADKFKEIASKAKEEIISCAKSITSAITAENRKKKTVVLFSAITVVLLIGLIIALSVSNCGGMDAQEKQCLIDLQTGLQNRWDSTDADYMSYEEYQNNISAGIDAELAMMVKYEDVTFKDDEFDAIISDYINALESQKEGVSFLFTDAEKYNNLYMHNGYVVRSECISKLNEKYNFNVKVDYDEHFNSLLDSSFSPLVAPGEQVRFDTVYGELGITFIDFDTLVNPGNEKELVIYCEIENFSYFDEWNGESLLFDYFMGVYDGSGYTIQIKGECYDYIDGYAECAGFADVRQGEKGKFAIILDYPEDIDIIGISFGGTEKTYSCYLTSDKWKAANPSNSAIQDNIDYTLVREQMSNFSCDGMYKIHDGWVYSINFPEDGGDGILSKMRTDGTEYTVLTKKGTPYFINVDGEYIYFIIGYGTSTKLYRCRLGGNDLTQLVEDDVWYLQVSEDYLYYTKNDNQTGLATGFFRAHKDGSNEEILLDKEVYYSYVVADNLFYQDDNDNETIHKYNLVTKTDERITTEKSYGFVIDGQFGYYIKNDRSAADGDYVGSLIKIDLQTKQETLLYDGVSTFGMVVGETSIYFINTNDQNRIYRIGKDGEEVKLVTQDTNCTNLAIFGNRIMYLDCDDSGKLVDAIYICQEDGSNKINISRSE